MLKIIQWLLFLLVAIGMTVGILLAHSEAFGSRERDVLLLFMGLSLSLYIFLFISFSTKFFLSELLTIFVVLAVEMTFFVNTMRQIPIDGYLLLGLFFLAILAPIALFWIINRRRDTALRFGDALSVRSPNQKKTDAIAGFIFCIFLFVLILPYYVAWFFVGSERLHPIPLGITALALWGIIANFRTWRACQKKGGPQAASPLHLSDDPGAPR